ncbi:MAG: Rdx family protein [Candidatus Marinimicrobia bacterium]|uniref:SelT/SelW/SelH family protein n=1 Tax=marine metagenome TaxID=408172 RepID=A0A382C622_9ZZZZ|nr:Rdx family protein [Candidatus Neomarinimicrobiota bacterium]
MANEILEKYGTDVKELTLIPSGGGVFEVIKNGDLIFSKKSLDRFPDDGEVMNLIESG